MNKKIYGWKIKVLTPDGPRGHWFVTSIKNNGVSFSGSSHENGAKIYKKKSSFQSLLDHLDKMSCQYELIKVEI